MLPSDEPPLGICDRHTGMSGSNPHPLDNGCWVWQPIIPALPSDEEAEPPMDEHRRALISQGIGDTRLSFAERVELRTWLAELLARLDAAEARGSRLEAVVEAARAVAWWNGGDGPQLCAPERTFYKDRIALLDALATLDASVVVPDAPENQEG